MPKIEIDGIAIDADEGTSIIEVADRMSIPIPRFCYHHKLSVAANCRMCLVHISKSSKPVPACATPVSEGMQVWTTSPETKEAQRAVMEYLLINHPLDCPICDQGGECELQDVSMQYGNGDSEFAESKRAVLDENLGPLISTEMTRCIHCTRCVRFGDEISGERELGAVGRGENVQIGTYVADTVSSEVSGNVIDLCPVGALTSKPYRFKARAWELTATPGIAPHDCIGSNIYWHSLNKQIMRVVPKETEELNEVWLSDRDRFSYEALYHTERLRKPQILQKRWNDVAWTEAIRYTIENLKKCIYKHGPDEIGILLSPSISTEEMYLLHKFAKQLGCNNIDIRLRQLDFNKQEQAPIHPSLGIDFRNIVDLDSLLIIGSNIAKEQPLANIRIRKMTKREGSVFVINSVDYDFNFAVAAKNIVPIADLVYSVSALAKELITQTKYKVEADTKKLLKNVIVSAEIEQMAKSILATKNKRHILLGQIATMHPQASQIWGLTNLIANVLDATYGAFSDGSNATGAWLTGCLPHRDMNGVDCDKPGKNAFAMLSKPLKGYILYGIDPAFDSILGMQAHNTLKDAELVVAFNPFQSKTLQDIANVVLPIACAGEYSGSFFNVNGTQQYFEAGVSAFGESKPGWKVLRLLASQYGCSDFDYSTFTDVCNDLQQQLPQQESSQQWHEFELSIIAKDEDTALTRLGPLALYSVDEITRRAKSLQKTKDAHIEPSIFINSNVAKSLNVEHNEVVLVANCNSDVKVKLCVQIDDKVADKTAIVYQATEHTIALEAPYSKIEVRKC